MHDYLPFVVIGLTTGGVYALAALGLVLTYKTSGVFNFAHGAIGMFATYVFFDLRKELPTPLAVAIAVLVVAPLMGATIDRLLLRRLQGAPTATFVVAAVGLLVGLQALAVAIYGGATRRVAPIFPTSTYRAFGIQVGIDQTLVVAIALGSALALIVFFQKTHLGLQTRAVVSDRTLIGLAGVNAGRVTTVAWMLGCMFAALSGILFAPFIGLDSLLLTLLVVQAFGAAAVGRLRSLPMTMAGAFGLGVAQSMATKLVSDSDIRALAGLPSALPFIVLVVVLLLSRPGRLNELTTSSIPARSRRTPGVLPFPTRTFGGFVVIAALLPPVLSESRMLTLTATVAFVLVFMSLSLLVGLSRQVSLTHAAFVVFGATTLSHLLQAGVPYLVALPLSAVFVVPIGAAMAFPAIRLSGLYLALATFGFGILAQNLLFPTAAVFGANGFVTITRPVFLSSANVFFYFVLAVTAAGVVAVEVVRVTRLGRVLVALADSPPAVQMLGVNPLIARVLTFCLSAFLAALAGGLLGTLVQSVNPESFNFFLSLVWIAVLMTAGARTLGGAILAAVLLAAVPGFVTWGAVTTWQPVAFGVAAILLAQTENGLVGFLRWPDFAALAAANCWRLDSTRSLERLRSADRAAVEA